MAFARMESSPFYMTFHAIVFVGSRDIYSIISDDFRAADGLKEDCMSQASVGIAICIDVCARNEMIYLVQPMCCCDVYSFQRTMDSFFLFGLLVEYTHTCLA